MGRVIAGDWPQYRGPDHDGVSLESIRTNWSEESPRQVWKINLGSAFSSVALSGSRAFTQARRTVGGEDREFCIALDAETGTELWATDLDRADYPNGGAGSDDGPRSTPSVAGDRVLVLTSYLQLYCLGAGDGRVRWSVDLKSAYGGEVIPWQNAASPLVLGDLVLVNGNGWAGQRLLAFHIQNGQLAWKGQNDRLTHATPVAATIQGVPQAIFFAQSGLVSVAPETGAVLWRHALRYNGTSVAASPVVAGDLVYCSRGYAPNAGAVVVRVGEVSGALAASEVWSKPNQLMNHWGTPVHYQGHLYGLYGQDLLYFKCLELATGVEKWSVDGFGYGSVLVVGDRILALTEWGELVLVEPNPAAYTERARFRALTGKCWNVPAIRNGRIYVRSTTQAVCLDVAPPPPPPLVLDAAVRQDEPALDLGIANQDGSPIAPNRAAKVELWTTDGLDPQAGVWTRFTNEAVLTNGRIRAVERLTPETPQRFFRTQERP
jgi:outer membrane protein assembly factor BamB